MRALLLEPDPKWLEERRRLGHDTRDIEVYILRGTTYFAVAPDRNGIIRAPRLGLELRVVEGPKLRIAWADGSAAEI